jgi:7-cyano-7-deazaguanine synthase
MKSKCVTLLSGGLDSSTLAFYLAEKRYEQIFISFDYGQKHRKELIAARYIASMLECSHHVIELEGVGVMLKSALTGSSEIPEGHYAEDNMRSTVVPNRNAIMLSVAYALGSSIKAAAVAIAAHGGDHFQYPDCRPQFFDEFVNMEAASLAGFHTPILIAPFSTFTKTDIARAAGRLKVPVELTWSCYKGEKLHCSKCGTCIERREALMLAGVKDYTQYADDTYWKTIIKNHGDHDRNT